MTIREWAALCILLICLVLFGIVDTEAGESYTWVYGGYSYTPKQYNDEYLTYKRQDWAVGMVGKTYCEKVDSSTSWCVKVYYQHARHYDEKDLGINGLNDGLEYRWY